MKSNSEVFMMISLIVISASTVCGAIQKPNCSIFKEPLGIADLDIESVDVKEILKNSLDQATQREVSAAVYILHGSIAPYAEHETGSMTVYNERTVTTNIVSLAKEFLMDVAISHSNKTTRSLASITIAYAFPNDEQVSEWIFDQYFFGELNRHDISNLIKTINFGRYGHPKAKVCVINCISRNEIEVFLSAVVCIKENHKLYPEAYTALIPAMLTFSDRVWDMGDSSSPNIRNITKTMLESAVSRCKESKTFLSEISEFK